jgi:dTDP-4-dehydrorhamnose reductase
MSTTTHPEFLIYGANGYLGSHIVTALRAQAKTFEIGKARIENKASLEAEIDSLRPKYVICAAGLAGKPNVNWFEDPKNKPEAVRINVVAQLNVADVCYARNLHCTLLGTGMMYNYDAQHPLEGGNAFKEDDPANYTGLYYVELRILLEQLLKAYPNVLNLRVLFPISSDFSNKSLNGKLITFKQVVSVRNSFTVVDSLCPYIPIMAERKITGTLNFTNPGAMSHGEILKLYKEHVDPNFEWTEITKEEFERVNNVTRPNAELDASKLLQYFPNIKNVRDAVADVMTKGKEMLKK